MIDAKQNQDKIAHMPSLDGVRGYGFLAIFLAHYLWQPIQQHRTSAWGNCLYYVENLAWLGVPTFFVLSGYLIGGILFNSRNREGFFRVFYIRRMLRILPVYYVTLLVIACVDLAHGVPLKLLFWSHFVYIQNLMPGYSFNDARPINKIIHLWSLAIEEQFYLTWPIVVWFVKDRKPLLKIIAILCAMCWILRLISPWIHLSITRCYYSTPTRVDAILLGVALALFAHHELYKRLQPLAKYVVVAGVTLWLISFSTHPDLPDNYFRVAVEVSLANLTVFALVAAITEKGSGFERIFSVRWACWLGTMSYGLYVYHFTYHIWFANSLRPQFSKLLPDPWDYVATAIVAFAVTLGLGILSYRLMEQPILSLKKYFNYGPVLKTEPARKRTPIRSLAPSRN